MKCTFTNLLLSREPIRSLPISPSLQVNILEPELKKQNIRWLLPFGYALLNDSNNVEWHASLAPETEVELRLVYSVEYPLQDDVQGLPKS